MKAKSRSAIISAAVELFAKKGFSATTTDEIARKAKVSKGLIFSHFATKQDILLAIYDEELERLLPKADEKDNARPAKERFISLVNSWLSLLKDEPSLVRLSLQMNLDEGWRKLLKRKGKQYIELYLDRMRDLLVQLGSKKPDLDSYLLGVLFDGITANYFVAPELFPIDAIKDHFIETLLSRWENQQEK
jgi:AcrR family transcriptional regulator